MGYPRISLIIRNMMVNQWIYYTMTICSRSLDKLGEQFHERFWKLLFTTLDSYGNETCPNLADDGPLVSCLRNSLADGGVVDITSQSM